jgi:plasmid replication initiation protein
MRNIRDLLEFDNCVDDFANLFRHFALNQQNLIDVDFTMQIVKPKEGKKIEGMYLIDIPCFKTQYLKTFRKKERIKKEAEKLIKVCESENIIFVIINLVRN